MRKGSDTREAVRNQTRAIHKLAEQVQALRRETQELRIICTFERIERQQRREALNRFWFVEPVHDA